MLKMRTSVLLQKQNQKKKEKSRSGLFLLFLFIIFLMEVNVNAASTMEIKVFGSGCSKCLDNYADNLFSELEGQLECNVEVFYLANDPIAKKELDQIHEGLKVPSNMRRDVVVYCDERFLFEGSVPVQDIADFLVNNRNSFNSLVVFRDTLNGVYRILDEKGKITELDLGEPISNLASTTRNIPYGSTLGLVFVSGLIDGINPCAFAVLLFFITFLFASISAISSPDYQGEDHVRKRILLTGVVYIAAVYLAYLVIGVTFYNVIAMKPVSDLIAKAGAGVMILLGLVNIKDFFWPGKGFSLGMSSYQWDILKGLMRKVSLPAAFASGLIVGVFEFPCTGGVYLAILGLLASNYTFFSGLFYLLIYNLAFVVPLVVILFIASNDGIGSFSLKNWHNREHRTVKLISGLLIVALGIFLLMISA